jgi:anion-transporting  ArsA/GET3 family ATPase
LERAATKDKDMSELMKSISDVQRIAQDREQEVHQLRKVADDRTLEAEKKVLLLYLEKLSLEKALDEAKANLVTREKTIQELQKHISDYKIDLALSFSTLILVCILFWRTDLFTTLVVFIVNHWHKLVVSNCCFNR